MVGSLVLDQAVVIAGCEVDIGDERVAGVGWIDFPEGDPDQLLILADIPQYATFEGGRFDSLELDPCDLGLSQGGSGKGANDENGKGQSLHDLAPDSAGGGHIVDKMLLGKL